MLVTLRPPPSSLQLRLYTEHLRWRKVAVSVLHCVVCGDAGGAHHPEIRGKIVGGGGEQMQREGCTFVGVNESHHTRVKLST